MINSLQIFNSDVEILRLEKGVFSDTHWTGSNIVYSRPNALKVLNRLYKEHHQELAEAIEKDIEKRNFPITVELTFNKNAFKGNCEMESFIIVDVKKVYFVMQQIFFRNLIKKMCNEYYYSQEVQQKINNFLIKKGYFFNDEGELKFRKQYDTVLTFDKDLKDFAQVYRDNLENINKTMFT